jgi:hypothetical protein
MTELTITELFTPADSDAWETSMLANANTLGLKTTAWEPGSPTLTIMEIVSHMMGLEDGLISIMAQGGFLDFAATGVVTYTGADGSTITQAVTPDPSDPAANPTGALGWLDLLARSNYSTSRILASFATGSLAVGNTSGSTLNYTAGTYHVENPSTGATYNNAATIAVPQGTLVGTAITGISNASPGVVTTNTAHGLIDGQGVVISGVAGMTLVGVFFVTVVSPTSFKLLDTDTTGLGTYTSGGTVRTVTLITVVADVAGTGGTSNEHTITEAVTTNPGVYVSNPAALIGSGFETNVALAARCRARLASLSPNGPRGAYEYFALSASRILGDASDPLFLPPAITIPAITRATVARNSATGIVTVTVASASGAVGGVTNLAISNVTNGTPIQVTTASAHGLASGDIATIAGALGVPAANGTWTITVISPTVFSLNGSVGSGSYLGGGIVEGGVLGQVDRVIRANAVPDTVTEQTVSAIDLDVAIVASVTVPVAYVATYTAAVQTALALFNAAVPIGGLVLPTVGPTGLYEYTAVSGVLYAAGIIGASGTSYVKAINSLTINGTAGDLSFPSSAHVARLTPPPVVNVIGV